MGDARRLSETPFGYFDLDSREYVITTHATPTPWINYLGLEGELCAIVSATGGGPTWLKDPLERRITRYFQVGSSRDRPGRWLYVRDNEAGEFWSATWQPVIPARPDAYECRHGPGYTRITSRRRDIRTRLTHLIPLGTSVEVQRVTVENTGSAPRRLSLFTYREFVNGTAANDLTNVQYSGHIATVDPDPDDGRILYLTTPQQRPGPLPFCAVSRPPDGFDTKLATFIGDGSVEAPQAVREGVSHGSLAGQDTAVGVFRLDLELAPGQSETFDLVVGVAADRAAGRQALEPWLDGDDRVPDAIEEVKAHAAELLATLQCEVPDPHMQVMVNTWNAYQCWVNFLFSRSISGYALGLRRSMGTRDSLQDLLGYMHMAPRRARARLIEIIRATQLCDGSCRHQYSALTGEGSEEAGYSDDHLWTVLAAAAYVKETGDLSVLDEEISYSDDRTLSEDVFGHLLRAVRYSFDDRGAHGLPRLRAADWNDTIGDGPDDEVSESVLVGMMLVQAARDLGELAERSSRGGTPLEEESEATVPEYLRQVAETMTETINREAWVEGGPWYARGTDAEGRWFGVPEREEGKIFLEPQPWSVLAGVAEEERARQAMDSVQRMLATEMGIHILTPACSVAPSGNFHAFPKGAKENGGIFCHPNPWAVCAEAMLGRGGRAYRYYRAILPPSASEADPAHYAAEPYVYGQIRYGREHREYGKVSGTWLTGTAAWNYVAATQYILGVRPDWDGLRIDPCLPADWRELHLTRRHRGATYRIHITNPDAICRGVRSVTCDGEPVEGNVLPVFNDGAEHRVEVVMG